MLTEQSEADHLQLLKTLLKKKKNIEEQANPLGSE